MDPSCQNNPEEILGVSSAVVKIVLESEMYYVVILERGRGALALKLGVDI